VLSPLVRLPRRGAVHPPVIGTRGTKRLRHVGEGPAVGPRGSRYSFTIRAY
jgi:hypothetical protein